MQEQINEETVAISESLPKNDKELVTISSEEYERLVADAKKIARHDITRRFRKTTC